MWENGSRLTKDFPRPILCQSKDIQYAHVGEYYKIKKQKTFTSPDTCIVKFNKNRTSKRSGTFKVFKALMHRTDIYPNIIHVRWSQAMYQSWKTDSGHTWATWQRKDSWQTSQGPRGFTQRVPKLGRSLRFHTINLIKLFNIPLGPYHDMNYMFKICDRMD